MIDLRFINGGPNFLGTGAPVKKNAVCSKTLRYAPGGVLAGSPLLWVMLFSQLTLDVFRRELFNFVDILCILSVNKIPDRTDPVTLAILRLTYVLLAFPFKVVRLAGSQTFVSFLSEIACNDYHKIGRI